MLAMRRAVGEKEMRKLPLTSFLYRELDVNRLGMGGVRAKSSFVAKFEAAVENLPMKEAVKYKSFDIRLPDLKWTAREYDVRFLCELAFPWH
jgi:hypothetical protein